MKFGVTDIILKQGDISKEVVDVIVNAANPGLCGGGGVDGAIHKTGGPVIQAECKQIIAKIKKCEPGNAVITEAGKLKAKYVVHAVGPVWHGGKKGEAEELADAYYYALLMAKEYGAKTIALPAISTGAYNYPIELAAEVALKSCKDFCEEHQHFTEIRLVLFTPEHLAVFNAALEKMSS
jgi:O-acetyl-ADP-ribose deacetylase (regulator of RNase III)